MIYYLIHRSTSPEFHVWFISLVDARVKKVAHTNILIFQYLIEVGAQTSYIFNVKLLYNRGWLP